MNEFTKEIYKNLGMDYKKDFIKQIENKANKNIFRKIDKFLKSNEYEIISNKLPIEDAGGFIDYIYAFFEKRHDYIGGNAKKRFKDKDGIKTFINDDIKKINNFKEFINKVASIKRFNGKVISASFGFGANTNANRKLIDMAQFIDEMIEDLSREAGEYNIFTEYNLYYKKTNATLITNELRTYDKFTKKELEKITTKLNSINK